MHGTWPLKSVFLSFPHWFMIQLQSSRCIFLCLYHWSFVCSSLLSFEVILFWIFFYYQPSPFFTEQLKAFEVWLDHGSEQKKPPEQLPIVLQVWKHVTLSCALFFKFFFYLVWFLFFCLKYNNWDACYELNINARLSERREIGRG